MAIELRADSIHMAFIQLLIEAGLRFSVVPTEHLHPDYSAQYIAVYVIGKAAGQ